MALDDILARFPDNNIGGIDAEDMRYMATEFWDRVELLEARVAALEAGMPTSGDSSFSVPAIWQVNPQAGATPGGGQVSSDTGDFGTATTLTFAVPSKDGTDVTSALQSAVTIYLQQKANAQNWARYDLNGVATVESGYVSVPVMFILGSGSTSGAAWQDAIGVIRVEVPA